MTRPGETDVRLTRRGALGALAGAGAATLLRPGTGIAAVTEGAPPSVFTLAVGSVNGSSGPIAAPRTFSLVGVEWSSPGHVHIQLRVRGRSGSWSPWAVASTLGHGPDELRSGAPLIGEGIWTGPAENVELRSSRPLHGVRLHFVAPEPGATFSGRAAAASQSRAQPILNAGPGQPSIIARQVWARGKAPPAVNPGYGTVKLAFVHHTDNPNGYSSDQVPSILYSIYQFHRYTRGWDDIGYNFVIDLFGRIWEARKGGIDQAVVGAQAGGYNKVSTGVAILGTFDSVLPTASALDALQRLLAWKLSLHGVPTSGRVTVEVNPADAFYTPFKPGARVSLPRVAGHRDGDSTGCPGDALYGHLPAVRSQVQPLAKSPLRLSFRTSAAKVRRGTPVVLYGTLKRLSGAPVSGATIELQQISASGAETTFQRVTTNAAGGFSATLTPQRNVRVRALRRAAPAAVSDSTLLVVR
jgi:N-acetylmuramoyl-L-alanine amidase